MKTITFDGEVTDAIIAKRLASMSLPRVSQLEAIALSKDQIHGLTRDRFKVYHEIVTCDIMVPTALSACGIPMVSI